jgi:AcrR family transcriptional regulator
MAKAGSARPSTNGAAPKRVSSRSKRDAIISNAIEIFARDGYEDSKWADVAEAVGIGSTALYHYFESKVHCLYVIMTEALEAHRREFDEVTRRGATFEEALTEALQVGFRLTDHEVLRMRILVAEQGLVGVKRKSEREEAARVVARERMRELEFAWATFLVRGMDQGIIPEADPAMLARALLGLNTSVWHWYRPGGTVSLSDIERFYVARQLAVAHVGESVH